MTNHTGLPYQPASPSGPAVPSSRSRRKAVLSHGLVAVVALGLGAGVAGNGNGAAAAAPRTVTRTVTVTATPTAQTTATPKSTAQTTAASGGSAVSVPGDGEYLVSVDMKPGTYKTKGPANATVPNCYWERDRDSSGAFDSIIANDNLSGTGRVTVEKGEVFKTNGCRDWVKVG